MEIIEAYSNLTNIKYLSKLTFNEFWNLIKKNENSKKKDDYVEHYNLTMDFCKDVIKANGEIKRLYTYSNSVIKGRMFSSKSIQSMNSTIRGFLCEHTTDIDMCNAHPVILKYICDLNEIRCPHLTYYIENREELLNDFPNKSEGKQMFLVCINSDKKYRHTNKINGILNDVLSQFDNEMKFIQSKLFDLSQFNYIKNGLPIVNAKGSFINKIMCVYENSILQSIIQNLKNQDFEIFALMFDGVMIYGNEYENAELLEDLSSAINNEFIGLKMKLCFKPHKADITLPIDYEENLLISSELDGIDYTDLSTDLGTVKYIKDNEPSKIIWIKGLMYCWNGKKWEQNDYEFIRYLKEDMTNMMQDVRKKALKLNKPELVALAMGIIKKWNNRTSYSQIIKSSEETFNRNDVEFDKNKNLFGFTNGVYDLLTDEFRPYKYDDYITMNCGFDYEPTIDPTKYDEIVSLTKKIFPNEEKRELYLSILSAGITGNCIEKFVVANGCGRNGKGVLSELTQLAFGDYGYIYAPVCLLTEKDKTGANPEKFKLHNKRIVIMKEPSSVLEKIRNDRVKDITGGGNISGRDLYGSSKDCSISLCQILIMEVNVKPTFAEEPVMADIERVIDIDFENRFTTNPDEIDNINVFGADIKYKSDTWKQNHKSAFLYVLFEYFKKFRANNYIFKIPRCIQDRTNEYLNESYPMLQIINLFIIKTNVKTDFLTLKDIFRVVESSQDYNLLDKKDKRKYNQKYFREFLSTHSTFKNSYFDRKKINNVVHSSVLMGYSIIPDEDNAPECLLIKT